jgi:dTDP-4-amino-4,6-dideoxygalactose transaminase
MKKISFNKPFIGEEEIKAVSKVIRSGWITSAKEGEKFEKKFASYVGSKYVIFLNSCTSALNLSVEWYKIKYGIKKVLVPSMTFVATVQAVINAGLKPVFGDIDNDLLLIPGKKKYDAVIPVHLYGNKSLRKWNVPCIEDSAHLIERNQCKNNPNIVTFSFFATKNLTTGEGGMLCTNDKKLYLWAKQMRHHGISKSGYERYGKNKWKYDVEFNGYKYNNSDILAAIGIEQLKKFDLMQSERKRCVDLYNKLLGYNNKGLHLMPILVNKRDTFIKYMNKNGISCSVHFLPIHLMSIFKDKKYNLSNTEYFGKRLVSLPLFPGLKNKEIEYICKKVLETGLLIEK